jgi:hypothetical protein
MEQIQVYQTKAKRLSGTNYAEVYKKAFNIYLKIKKQSKRRTYIRSAYFNKEKIFLSLFWHHLGDKHYKDRIRRIKYFPCAIDLIYNSRFSPFSKENSIKKSKILHRFIGMTKEKEIFYVQIKENKNTRQKYLISVFPGK